MKEKTKKFHQSVLDFLSRLSNHYPAIAFMIVGSMSIGFILVAAGVMINLASTESILKLINVFK